MKIHFWSLLFFSYAALSAAVLYRDFTERSDETVDASMVGKELQPMNALDGALEVALDMRLVSDEAAMVGATPRGQVRPIAGMLHPCTDLHEIRAYALNIAVDPNLSGFVSDIDWGATVSAVKPLIDEVGCIGDDVRKYAFNVLGLLRADDIPSSNKFHMLVSTLSPFLPTINLISCAQEDGVASYLTGTGQVVRSTKSALFLEHLQKPLSLFFDTTAVDYLSLVLGDEYARHYHYNHSRFWSVVGAFVEPFYSLPKILIQMPLRKNVCLGDLVRERSRINNTPDILQEMLDQYPSRLKLPIDGTASVRQVQKWSLGISEFDCRGQAARRSHMDWLDGIPDFY